MTIGLLCAIPEELEHLREVLETTNTTSVAGFQFDEGWFEGRRVVLAGSGMGKVNAAVVTTLMATRFECRLILFSGVAGGLDPALHIGDVVVADRIVQHDVGRIENDGLLRYQAGHVSFINPTDALGYSMDADLLARVRAGLDGVPLPALSRSAGGRDRPPRVVFGTILTGDQYVHCDVTRQRLHGDLDGLAVEMEGGAVAQVCENVGIPWIVVRALSDLAGHDSDLNFAAFVSEVAAISSHLVRRIVGVL
ncbi:5'-methylthioadenosine/adenosylhomocysteine nucleosidase [Mycobacterium sp. AT1]|uniref:5'-methylthioadenosine/adenosylhomocysteine nucleosidase n=1 Tax=Mycobacterium sp. AT1 TaxID=1961706 RepID=UPI0009ADC5D8|nr:5'-methylthioadenosine/adenosylhomocysteine nucleosidase [Mycobacterium sp. AT1]OPX09459.1 5'-methylthioadenosine/S-adenosylhomocysteine nucleosidase [Mycobacterium sp. AT1]